MHFKHPMLRLPFWMRAVRMSGYVTNGKRGNGSCVIRGVRQGAMDTAVHSVGSTVCQQTTRRSFFVSPTARVTRRTNVSTSALLLLQEVSRSRSRVDRAEPYPELHQLSPRGSGSRRAHWVQ